mgnify:CR=1 FL=1
MRLVLQRVEEAAVVVDGEVVGAIGRGLLVLVGIETGDDASKARAAADRIGTLRLFPDEAGRTNRSVADARGSVLVVSQFTLLAAVDRGRRPSFSRAARPEVAAPLVELLIQLLLDSGTPVASGRFGAEMRIRTVLDGPFTLQLEI